MKKRLIARHPVAELASLLLFGIFVLFLLLMLLFSARIYQQTVKNTNAENTLGTAVSYLTTKFRQHDTVNGIFTGKLDNLSALCFRDTLNDQDYITYIYLDQGNLKELFTSDSSSANASAGTTIAQLSDFQISESRPGFYSFELKDSEGNKETIWGLSNQFDFYSRYPLRILKKSDGTWHAGYSGVSPTLYTIEHFYTANGKLPEKDLDFTPSSEWFESAGLSSREDIIKLNVGREPRFYAWMAFDGGDYGTKFAAGSPLKLEMRNAEMHGYNPSLFNRDHSVTGFLTQKFVDPVTEFYTAGGATSGTSAPTILFRLAELYLNVAECQAALGNTQEAIDALNPVRERAGIPKLTIADVTSNMTIKDWVHNERFVELWNEGHRFFDVRRWAEGAKYFGAGKREGLNAEVQSPTFEEFNKRTIVDAPYVWENRMYLNPVFYNEVYKNPQMVQAPGY